MDQNFEALRKTAEAATPGPWTHQPYGGQNQNGDYFGGWLLDADGEYVVADVSDRDGAFMATFNPETVLALLSRLEQAEQQVQAVLRLADSWETGALRWEDPLRVPNEVFLLRKALHQPTHEPDWTDYQLGDPGASCSCGYNGPYKECWQSRRALDGDGRG